MNKIYKVIWSKAKHTYVVASEIAKGHTKGETTGKGLKRLAAALLVAAALLSPNFAWAADTTKVEPAPDGSATAVEVYTKAGADKAISTNATNISTNATAINTNAKNILSNTEKISKLESAVGDGDSGLKKDVNDLKTTVGDSTGGLVKDVADSKTAIDTEKTAREAGDKTLNDRITAVKEHVLKETGDNYVSKTDAAVQDAGVVKTDKKIGENVTALGKGLYDETAARIGADAAQDKVIKQVNDNLVASVNTINKNVADGFTALNQAGANEAAAREAKDNELNERITNEANAIHDEIKAGDKVLDDRITNVKEYLEKQTSDNYVSKADAAVQDGAVVKAANTIGENVTNLDAALAKETAARLGADKAQDKVIQQVNQNMVDGFNTINKNMSDGFKTLNAADANEAKARADADAAEKAARIGADAKLVEAVNSSISLSADNVLQKNTTKVDADGNVTTGKADVTSMILNKGNDNQITLSDKGIKVGLNSGVMDKDGFYAGGDTAEAAKAALNADGSIKGAGGIFTVDGTTGNVSTKGSLTAASGTIGNVSMSADGTVTGVKDLTASGKVTADSFTDGTATMSNGSLNGVNQINATGNIVTTGNMQAHDMTATGTITGQNINGTTGTFGSLSTTGNASVGGTLTTNGITNTGNTTTDSLTVKQGATVGGNLGVTGDITGKSLNVGAGAIIGGQITGTGLDVGAGTIKTTGAVETGTLKTTGKAEIGGDLTVTGNTEMKGNLGVKGNLSVEGEFNAKTLSSKLDENNYTTINGGKTESMNLKMDKKTGEIQASASTFDETGSNTWAKDDDSIGKSTVTADGISQKLSGTGDNPTVYAERTMSQGTDNKYSMADTVKDGDKTNVASQSATESSSVVSGKDGGNNYKSYITQNLKKILQKIEDGDGNVLTSTEQTETDITNTAKNGTITNDAKALVNKASDSITSQIGDGSAVKSVMDANGIANTATGGTISNSAANISNTTTENMTNTVGGNLIDTIMGTSTTTVTGKVTEDYKSDLSTKVGGDETHAVTGNQTTTVSGNRTVNVKGTETENFNAQVTNVKTDQKTSVGGNQTNIVGGDQQNTVSGNKTETVKGSVKEKYGSQATTVDGDQSTNIGGNQTTVVAKDQTNTVSGNKTETVKGAVNETYGSQTTKVNGDQSTTVTGKQTNSITGDQVNTIGGNQTTTVTGDSSLSAKNITNTATVKLSNSAAEIENSASKSITDKVGDNVSRTMTTSQIKESVADGANSNTSTKTGSKDMNIVTDGTSTSTLSQLAGSVNTSLKEVDSSGNSVKSLNNVQTVSEDTTKITDTATGDFSSRSQKANGFTSQVKNNSGGSNTVTDTATTSEQKLVSGNIIDILKDAETGYVNTTVSSGTGDDATSTSVKQGTADITNTAKQGTITNEAKNLVNKAEEKLSNSAAEIENTATTSIKDTVGKSTVTTTTDGTTFENTDHNGAIGDGSIKKTTISGNTLETGKATMDYAEVMKDLGVGGTTTTKDLHVTNNATIDGILDVTGAANFQNTVTVAQDLSVGGNATVAGDVTAKSYKVGDKTYIDENGINANSQKITNVAAGELSANSMDAVNGSQLYETNTRVSGLETRMGTVETKVDKLDGKIDKVGANAAAMANLHPLEFDEDSKWNIAAAVGSSGSETASAVGVFYRPNENVMVNASAAMGTGENMFGGGVSLRLGHGGNKAKEAQMKAAAAENKELRAKVDDLTARMDALLSVLNPNMSKDFPDVPENHWAYEAVSRLAGNGIVEGYEDGKYHGERQMTRYEMAEIIYNALSKGAKAEKKLVEEFRPELQAMAAQKKA